MNYRYDSKNNSNNKPLIHHTSKPLLKMKHHPQIAEEVVGVLAEDVVGASETQHPQIADGAVNVVAEEVVKVVAEETVGTPATEQPKGKARKYAKPLIHQKMVELIEETFPNQKLTSDLYQKLLCVALMQYGVPAHKVLDLLLPTT